MKISPFWPSSASVPSRNDFTCNSCGGSKYSNGARKFLIVFFGESCAAAIARQSAKQQNDPAHNGPEPFRTLLPCFSVRIFSYHTLPLVLRLQNHFRNLADGSVAAMRLC